MRSLVFIFARLILYHDLLHRPKMQFFVLIFGFVLATIVGELRTGGLTDNGSLNVTHFGSVTISSQFLLNLNENLTLKDNFSFSIGMVLANFLPSSLLPTELNLRKAIVEFADIPGGGWMPVFVYVAFGYLIFPVILITIVYFTTRLKICRISLHTAPRLAFMVIFICTAPRWFMYTPFQFIKMPLYGLILVLILQVIVDHIKSQSRER